MSGKPYPEGVATTIDLLEKIQALNEEAIPLELAVTRLTEVREEVARLYAELIKLLRSMDVSENQRGNTWHEHRLAWFLGEMRRRVNAAPTTSTKKEG